MIRGLMSASLVLVGATCVMAFGHGPSGPPSQQLVRIDASGQMQLYYQVMVCYPETREGTVQKKVPVTKEVQEEVDGEVRTKTVTEYQTVVETMQYTVMQTKYETKVRNLDPAQVKAFETDGRRIPADKLAARFKEDTLVLVSANGEMIPDYIAGLFKQGTVILAFDAPEVVPVSPAGEGAPPVPPGEGPPQAKAKPFAIRTVSQEKEGDEAVQLRVPESTPAPVFPSAMPPLFLYASRDGAETIKLRQTNEYTYNMTSHVVKRHGTGKQMKPVQVKQTNRNTQITAVSGKDLQFFAGDGKPVPFDRVKEKLTREATVIYTADGEEIDPFWLQNLKPTTLVLVGPQIGGGCGPAMGGHYASPPAPATFAAPAPAPPEEAAPPQPPATPAEDAPKPPA